ncbi:MAG: HAD family hydrolase [Lachnospiraceae bacterium]|nr:HAD family hydrolase [Lachnospiraceae bacterium]
MEKKYLLFDLDGTLTDPMVGITKSVQYALRRYGIEEPELTKLTPFIGPPLRDSFMKYYQFSKEQADEAVWVYREYFAEKGIFENEELPGIRSMLERLQKAGKVLLVATSKPEKFARQILEYFQLDSYFTFIGGADMGETRVKKEDVIRYVMEHQWASSHICLEADQQKTDAQKSDQQKADAQKPDQQKADSQAVMAWKAEAVMVGDREHDIIGAKINGLQSVGVLMGYGSREELELAGADRIASDAEELTQILLENWK